jgi:hypothetical protein
VTFLLPTGQTNMDISKDVQYIVENWEKIPESFKTNLGGYNHIEGVKMEDHVVVLLLDRQKPSVQADWDFDEERISINRKGQVIWGFDSGCSCPSPWNDSFPDCYSCDEGWKEFVINESKFDHGAMEECLEKINEIKSAIQS